MSFGVIGKTLRETLASVKITSIENRFLSEKEVRQKFNAIAIKALAEAQTEYKSKTEITTAEPKNIKINEAKPASGQNVQKMDKNLEKAIQFWQILRPQLNSYVGYQSKSIKIDQKTYLIDRLFEEKNNVTPFKELNFTFQQQVYNLILDNITPQKVIINLQQTNDRVLDIYWTNFKKRFSFYANYQLSSFLIDDKTYKVNHLWTYINKNSTISDLPTNAKTQLQTLFDDSVIAKDVETYLNSLEKPAETKKSTNQNLAIGLGTAGGVVVLAGVGGFAYWFLKIRKS